MICTDPTCTLHNDDGSPSTESHRPLQRATTLELMIIMTFHDVHDYVNDAKRHIHFRDWKPEDLKVACEDTHDYLNVKNQFFERDGTNKKMRELEEILSGRGVEYVDRYNAAETDAARGDIKAEFFLGERTRGVAHGPPSREFAHTALLKTLLRYTQHKFCELDDHVEQKRGERFGRP